MDSPLSESPVNGDGALVGRVIPEPDLTDREILLAVYAFVQRANALLDQLDEAMQSPMLRAFLPVGSNAGS